MQKIYTLYLLCGFGKFYISFCRNNQFASIQLHRVATRRRSTQYFFLINFKLRATVIFTLPFPQLPNFPFLSLSIHPIHFFNSHRFSQSYRLMFALHFTHERILQSQNIKFLTIQKRNIYNFQSIHHNRVNRVNDFLKIKRKRDGNQATNITNEWIITK